MIQQELWHVEADSPDLDFERAVEEYLRDQDNQSLMRVLQLSLRSGSGVEGLRSPQRLRARNLISGRGEEEVKREFPYPENPIWVQSNPQGRGASPETEMLNIVLLRRVPMGSSHVPYISINGRVYNKILDYLMYPSIHSSLEVGEPVFNITTRRHPQNRPSLLGPHSLSEIISHLREILPRGRV